MTETELTRLRDQEEATLRELRLFLRDVVSKLGRDRKFSIFTKPVDEEEVPDYYQIIENPMDLASMMSKIDLHKYGTVAEFMDDIDLICHNALEYNPASNPQGKQLVRIFKRFFFPSWSTGKHCWTYAFSLCSMPGTQGGRSGTERVRCETLLRLSLRLSWMLTLKSCVKKLWRHAN